MIRAMPNSTNTFPLDSKFSPVAPCDIDDASDCVWDSKDIDDSNSVLCEPVNEEPGTEVAPQEAVESVSETTHQWALGISSIQILCVMLASAGVMVSGPVMSAWMMLLAYCMLFQFLINLIHKERMARWEKRVWFFMISLSMVLITLGLIAPYFHLASMLGISPIALLVGIIMIAVIMMGYAWFSLKVPTDDSAASIVDVPASRMCLGATFAMMAILLCAPFMGAASLTVTIIFAPLALLCFAGYVYLKWTRSQRDQAQTLHTPEMTPIQFGTYMLGLTLGLSFDILFACHVVFHLHVLSIGMVDGICVGLLVMGAVHAIFQYRKGVKLIAAVEENDGTWKDKVYIALSIIFLIPAVSIVALWPGLSLLSLAMTLTMVMAISVSASRRYLTCRQQKDKKIDDATLVVTLAPRMLASISAGCLLFFLSHLLILVGVPWFLYLLVVLLVACPVSAFMVYNHKAMLHDVKALKEPAAGWLAINLRFFLKPFIAAEPSKESKQGKSAVDQSFDSDVDDKASDERNSENVEPKPADQTFYIDGQKVKSFEENTGQKPLMPAGFSMFLGYGQEPHKGVAGPSKKALNRYRGDLPNAHHPMELVVQFAHAMSSVQPETFPQSPRAEEGKIHASGRG